MDGRTLSTMRIYFGTPRYLVALALLVVVGIVVALYLWLRPVLWVVGGATGLFLIFYVWPPFYENKGVYVDVEPPEGVDAADWDGEIIVTQRKHRFNGKVEYYDPTTGKYVAWESMAPMEWAEKVRRTS